MRVFIDTGVLVSAAISPAGQNAHLFDQIIDDKFAHILTGKVLGEYCAVFNYKRLRQITECGGTSASRK